MDTMLEELQSSQSDLAHSLENLQEATDELAEIEERHPVLKPNQTKSNQC